MAEHGDIHVVAKQDPRKSAQRADHRPENSWDFGALRAGENDLYGGCRVPPSGNGV